MSKKKADTDLANILKMLEKDYGWSGVKKLENPMLEELLKDIIKAAKKYYKLSEVSAT